MPRPLSNPHSVARAVKESGTYGGYLNARRRLGSVADADLLALAKDLLEQNRESLPSSIRRLIAKDIAAGRRLSTHISYLRGRNRQRQETAINSRYR